MLEKGPWLTPEQLRRRRAALRRPQLHRGGPADRAADVPQRARGRRAPRTSGGCSGSAAASAAAPSTTARSRSGCGPRTSARARTGARSPAPRSSTGRLGYDELRALLHQGRAADRRRRRPAPRSQAHPGAPVPGAEWRTDAYPMPGHPPNYGAKLFERRGDRARAAPLSDAGGDQQPGPGRAPGVLVLRLLLEPRVPDRGQERHARDRAAQGAGSPARLEIRPDSYVYRVVLDRYGTRRGGRVHRRGRARQVRGRPRDRALVLDGRHAAPGAALRAAAGPGQLRRRRPPPDGPPLPGRDRLLLRADRLLPRLLEHALPRRLLPRARARTPRRSATGTSRPSGPPRATRSVPAG